MAAVLIENGEAIQEGDIVYLASGSPPMTVVNKGLDQSKDMACIVIWVDPTHVPHQVTLKARVLSKRRNVHCDRFTIPEGV